jgi:hypothetical protein
MREERLNNLPIQRNLGTLCSELNNKTNLKMNCSKIEILKVGVICTGHLQSTMK